MTLPLFAVLPASVDDPAAPSGGNRYDREVLRHLQRPGDPSHHLRPPDVPGGPSSGDPAEIRPLPPAARKRQDGALTNGEGTVFDVREHLLDGTWPRPAEPDRQALAALLSAIPGDSLVLIDGLLACGVPDLLEPHATRLRLAVLVHLPLGDETGLTDRDAADLRALEARALKLATAVIATSEPAARRVEELHGLTGVHAVAPGVDPAPLAEPSPTGHRLLNVASLTPRKGQDLLLSVLQQLPDLPWTCTVAGGGRIPTLAVPPPATLVLSTTGPPAPAWETHRDRGPDGHTARLADTPDAEAPQEKDVNGVPGVQARDEHTVRFVGALGGAALDEAYASADLFVLPSRAETYGMVVTEALARGLPVVAADVGGVPEALGAAPGGGLPGRLIPPDDRDALAAALRDWLTDGAVREQWRAHARARRATLTGWDETARRLAQVLTGIRPPV
ncbi:glycosyltransferase family 4 protein [Actinoplanes xinjiangensis]|uniref:glycosyltransferase family 4 protein n=1 Tax=Actinoplanes xinjiangensis TaxID=512350 RepID=UPI00343076D7